MRLQDIIMREAPSAYIFESDGTVHRRQELGDAPDDLTAKRLTRLLFPRTSELTHSTTVFSQQQTWRT